MNHSIFDNITRDFSYNKDNKIIYLDNAATSQRPLEVINKVDEFYKHKNANPHRGAHYLSVQATNAYEGGRKRVCEYLGAESEEEIIFTRNATEAINLVAYSYGLNFLKEGDEILISILEHHSNLVPWQFVCKKTGAKLKYVYLDKDYNIDMDDFKSKLNKNVKLLAITGASNTVATCPNIEYMIECARAVGAKVLVDGAQLLAHKKVDVKKLDCDFLVFSGHKLLAPLGVGVLYGKKEILDLMPPYTYGGDMIEYVYEQETTYAELPYKFEAGTQNVGGVVGLHAALDYIDNIGMDNIYRHESKLMDLAYNEMINMKFIDVYTNPNKNRSPIILFNFKDIHPHDVSSILDSYGIAIRSGHHCAAPLHKYLGINSSCRASFSFYNTESEVVKFLEALPKVAEVFGYGH